MGCWNGQHMQAGQMYGSLRWLVLLMEGLSNVIWAYKIRGTLTDRWIVMSVIISGHLIFSGLFAWLVSYLISGLFVFWLIPAKNALWIERESGDVQSPQYIKNYSVSWQRKNIQSFIIFCKWIFHNAVQYSAYFLQNAVVPCFCSNILKCWGSSSEVDCSRLHQAQLVCESGFVCAVCCVDGRYSPCGPGRSAPETICYWYETDLKHHIFLVI